MEADIRDIIESLLNPNDADNKNTIPDGIIDLSEAIIPLRHLTLHGRALRSDETYAMAKMLGGLLNQYIPPDYSPQDLERCVFGLTVLIANILRTVNKRFPDTSIEDFLIDAASQDDLIELRRTMSCIPTQTTEEGRQHANVAQHPLFFAPVPSTPDTIEGFISRHILPYDDEDDDTDIDDQPPTTRLITPTPPPDISIHSDITMDPLNGFDEIFNFYFNRKYGYDTD
jgi:hypothetical protein